MSVVLVVDDEQSFLIAMRLTLPSAGHEVLVAESGEEGLLLIRQRKPDIVLLDIMMPGMGGLKTLDEIRALPEFAKLPVAMVSGVRPSVKNPKWNEFLLKPFSLAEVLRVIKKLT